MRATCYLPFKRVRVFLFLEVAAAALEELTGRIGLPAVQKAAAEDVERLTAGLVSRGRLRIDRLRRHSGLRIRTSPLELSLAQSCVVFISHASEDKDAVARPLAEELKRRGFSVWYDEYVLKLGDSLPAEIDRGLANSRFGVVILSPRFFAKNWPRRELDGACCEGGAWRPQSHLAGLA